MKVTEFERRPVHLYQFTDKLSACERSFLCELLTTICRVCHTGAKIESYFGLSGCILVSVTPPLCLTSSRHTSHSNQIKKNPQGLCSRTGECPISFSLGWLPAECDKSLCYAALLQISVAKIQWQGAPTCEMHVAEKGELLILVQTSWNTWQKYISDHISSGGLWLSEWSMNEKP